MEKVVCNSSIKFNLPNRIKNNEFTILKVLKDDKRSHVLLIKVDEEQYVYKVPKEKNKRVWQRILSFFRGSESRREYSNCLRISELGFKGATPIMYWEKRVFGMCFDSFFISSYLEGKTATINELFFVKNELEKIHKKGYLHGDSQLDNFMILKDEVYLIDVKLIKNKYGKAGAAYEFIYLEESCHKEIDIYDKTSLSYKLAKSLNIYLHWIGRMKKIIRRKER
ncbi:lipopolysaccharide core heptose(II) kinase RfaY [Cetobacterium sp. ZOR0034]|uniref:lipopolysaccharide core heptose(II) kinase RfaY n=1 Tax=Cetobacterium sp. ZOR0034 TaxID=1339239 RepID=UPI0009DCB5BC|nr:lipopolysaccharide core heptose(II) kinase RfaY [Cetobacterium sp. ZOR0034]